MNSLEIINDILDSDAQLIDEDGSNSKNRKVIDNRFDLIKNNVELIKNRSETFYSKLIKLLSFYINQLCDDMENFSQTHCELSIDDLIKLNDANQELSKKLFEYVCFILEVNKDIVLDKETIEYLLNRNPKLFNFSLQNTIICRSFDYKRLIKVLNENKSLEKSNISLDDIYQILFDTFQLNNKEVFCGLVSPENFAQNHQKINEILGIIDARFFSQITKIIICNFDKNFDRLSLVKKRNDNKFCAELIIELLCYYHHIMHEDYELIHNILTDPEIKIDYNTYYSDYTGSTNLKSIIALSKNPLLIKDLLSDKVNVTEYYSHGDICIQLFRLYGIIGDYNKALNSFNEIYSYKNDYFDDFNDDFDRFGSTFGGNYYKDSIAEFIKDVCKSFNEQNTDYLMRKEIIDKILDNDNVKYINLEETLPAVQKILSPEDFNNLLNTLLSKKNSGKLGFIVSGYNINDDNLYNPYVITLASDQEVQDVLLSLKKDDVKVRKGNN